MALSAGTQVSILIKEPPEVLEAEAVAMSAKELRRAGG
jgi:hypothetical protein